MKTLLPPMPGWQAAVCSAGLRSGMMAVVELSVVVVAVPGVAFGQPTMLTYLRPQ